MSLPTLAIKGKLIAVPNTDQQQEILDNYVPYKYIIKFLSDKLKLTGLENRFLALQARTASGKSTLLPAELYIHFIHPLVQQNVKNLKGIICTQPRIITAIENVKQILDATDNYRKIFKKGENIGWSTKYNKYKPKKYGLNSVTLGTLMVELQNSTDDEIMNKYQFILIDEVHERSQQLELLLFTLRRFLRRNADNPNCPFVILLSATFSPVKYAKYFGLDQNNVIMCDGATAHIEEIYLPTTTNNIIAEATKIVEKIVKNNTSDEREKGDILIFLPGSKEIKKMMKSLENINRILLIELTSETQKSPTSDYKAIEEKLPKEYDRRVIVATNVVETGMTINSLKYVIDSGYNRQNEFDPNYGLDLLINVPVAKSRMMQRRGRVGRKFDGVFYALYPKNIMMKLESDNHPEIMINDATKLLLSIFATTKIINIEELDFLQPIPTDILWHAIEKLYMLGFIKLLNFQTETIDYEGRSSQKLFAEWYSLVVEEKSRIYPAEIDAKIKPSITKLGKLAMTFSELHEIPLEYIRTILSGYYWKVSIFDLVRITAYCCTERLAGKGGINWSFIYEDVNAMKNRLLIFDKFIDGIYLFHSLESAFSKATDRKSANDILTTWCSNANINFHSMLKMISLRDNILDTMLMNEFDIHKYQEYELLGSKLSLQDRVLKIKYCLYDGFRLNLAYLDGTKYRSRNGNIEFFIRTLFSKHERQKLMDMGVDVNTYLPKVVLYDKLVTKMQNPTDIIMSVYADKISSLDGWIHIDI